MTGGQTKLVALARSWRCTGAHSHTCEPSHRFCKSSSSSPPPPLPPSFSCADTSPSPTGSGQESVPCRSTFFGAAAPRRPPPPLALLSKFGEKQEGLAPPRPIGENLALSLGPPPPPPAAGDDNDSPGDDKTLLSETTGDLPGDFRGELRAEPVAPAAAAAGELPSRTFQATSIAPLSCVPGEAGG